MYEHAKEPSEMLAGLGKRKTIAISSDFIRTYCLLSSDCVPNSKSMSVIGPLRSYLGPENTLVPAEAWRYWPKKQSGMMVRTRDGPVQATVALTNLPGTAAFLSPASRNHSNRGRKSWCPGKSRARGAGLRAGGRVLGLRACAQ